MSGFRDHFKKAHVFLPVIHAHTRGQVLRNVELAISNGADGVFMINHGHTTVDELIEYYHAARERYPDVWIGLNMQGISNRDAIGYVPEHDCALWTDYAGVDDTSEGLAHDFYKSSRKAGWRGMHFGGVAFKYQEWIADPASAARRAVPYVDVVTTSGESTGEPPSLKKVMAMREAIGNHPLAIASGISHRNVQRYHAADCFLVATSILVDGSNSEFDELKILRFINSLADMNRAASSVF